MTYIGEARFDLLSICTIYDWLHISFRIAYLAQDSCFACICLADDEDAKLRTLLADLCWI